jgi:ABC-2 type transport system ATP-binding protein
MIQVSSLVKRFKTKTAVSNLNFKAKAGEIVGFLGPNGAGKTTTMRLLLGYLFPSAGVIKIDKLNPWDERIEVLKKIGYLPENNPLYPEMKVREYLSFIAKIKDADNLESVMELVSLNQVREDKIEELSRGYKQRVGLAAALLGQPEILILDEPTSGLDPLEQEKIRSLIKKLAQEKTIIFSTHILSEVEDIANRLMIINEGKIVYDGVKPKGRGGVERLFKKLVKTNNY